MVGGLIDTVPVVRFSRRGLDLLVCHCEQRPLGALDCGRHDCSEKLRVLGVEDAEALLRFLERLRR